MMNEMADDHVLMGRSGGRPNVSKKAWFLLIPVLVFALPTLIFLVVALLPTLVAGIVDRRPQKYATYCVGGFNLSAAVPYLFQLWFHGNTMAALMQIVSNMYAWLIIYLGAAIGWGFHWLVPKITLIVGRWRDKQRIADLKKRQTRLVEEWGDELVKVNDQLGRVGG